jgi:hypothetical protein
MGSGDRPGASISTLSTPGGPQDCGRRNNWFFRRSYSSAGITVREGLLSDVVRTSAVTCKGSKARTSVVRPVAVGCASSPDVRAVIKARVRIIR